MKIFHHKKIIHQKFVEYDSNLYSNDYFISVCYSYECFKYEYLNEKGKCKWFPSGHYCPEIGSGYLKCGCDNCYKQDIIDEETENECISENEKYFFLKKKQNI